MHSQTQNHIYAILNNSFLLLFHGKKKKDVICLQYFYKQIFTQKRKWLHGLVALWTQVVKYCGKRFLEDF